MTGVPRSTYIIRRQEKLAERLLDRALEANAGVEPDLVIQLDIFEKIGKWVSIKNRIEDQEETQIASFKRRIHAQEVEAGQSRGHRAERLEAIKQRLPDRGGSGANGNSGDPGNEVPPVAG